MHPPRGGGQSSWRGSRSIIKSGGAEEVRGFTTAASVWFTGALALLAEWARTCSP
jgi:uncharacterized membrane protein YhiD involved in acid resistance